MDNVSWAYPTTSSGVPFAVVNGMLHGTITGGGERVEIRLALAIEYAAPVSISAKVKRS
jgi:hypothetical protein